MKYYTGQNVYDAALDRIRWLFDEFPNVVVSVSGGKDSTVIFNLALQVARERNRLPLKCQFIDQEAEWQATIDEIERIMTTPEVMPFWYQIPMVLFNATSAQEQWLKCWDPEAKDRWMHPQWERAITVNNYGTTRFHRMFNAVIEHDQPEGTANLGGIRTEESPTRHVAMTHSPKYKWVTWGKMLNAKKRQVTFYPIYDWSYTDVWKAIHDHGWHYNKIYDVQYQYGVPVLKMRVSNVHHETAVGSLFMMQEMEPQTYERLTQRIGGIDMAGKMGTKDYFPTVLPPMFQSWQDYRDYLLENLIENPEWREKFRLKFQQMEALYGDMGAKLYKAHISSILTNDWEFAKLVNFINSPATRDFKERKLGIKRYAARAS